MTDAEYQAAYQEGYEDGLSMADVEEEPAEGTTHAWERALLKLILRQIDGYQLSDHDREDLHNIDDYFRIEALRDSAANRDVVRVVRNRGGGNYRAVRGYDLSGRDPRFEMAGRDMSSYIASLSLKMGDTTDALNQFALATTPQTRQGQSPAPAR